MKQTEDYINELLAKYISGEELTDQEKNDIQAWIASNTNEYNRLVKLISPQKAPAFNKDKAWKKIELHINSKTTNNTNKVYDINKKRRTLGMPVFYAAASIIVIMIISISIFMNKEDYKEQLFSNNSTTKKMIYLPDSSSVVLYPNSYLSYKTEGISSPREISLNGKAFFNVRKMNGRSFKVKSENIMVEVLGTSFIVDATEADNSSVYVKTGIVSVESKSNKVIIKANQKAELNNDTLRTGKIEKPYEVFDERPKELSFSNSGILEVTEKIKETTGLIIDIDPKVQNNKITSKINTSNPEDIVKELAFLCNCRFEEIEKDKHYRLY